MIQSDSVRSRAAPRALFIANDPPGRAVYRYRCENFADALRVFGWHVDIAFVGDHRVRVDHDVVVLHRICMVAEGRAYVRAARVCGAVLVYGADDLVFDHEGLAARDRPDAVRRRLQRFAPLHAAMLREADAALLSTEYLAERARAICNGGKPVYVLRNFLSDTLLEISSQAGASATANRRAAEKQMVTLGYLSGTPSHDADLETIAEPLAGALTDCDAAELLLVGPVRKPDALTAPLLENKVRKQAFVPWRELPDVLANIDINLAPLDLTDPLTHGKSEIKLLEAAALRIPTVASAGAGFREASASGSGCGFLAESTNDWDNRLRELIADPVARSRAGEDAFAWLNAHGTAAANRVRVIDTFKSIQSLSRPRPAIPRTTVIAGSPLSPIRVKYWVKAALRSVRRD